MSWLLTIMIVDHYVIVDHHGAHALSTLPTADLPAATLHTWQLTCAPGPTTACCGEIVLLCVCFPLCVFVLIIIDTTPQTRFCLTFPTCLRQQAQRALHVCCFCFSVCVCVCVTQPASCEMLPGYCRKRKSGTRPFFCLLLFCFLSACVCHVVVV